MPLIDKKGGKIMEQKRLDTLAQARFLEKFTFWCTQDCHVVENLEFYPVCVTKIIDLGVN